MNRDAIHAYLAERSYWARNIPRELLDKAIANSRCYGIYRVHGQTRENNADREQAGFARVITDCATFGYLCDVFVLEDHRGLGLSKWLVECILGEPEFQPLRNWTLYTKDAHGLYGRFGFTPPKDSASVMAIKKENPYL
ncbi:MAG: GNAT family N-acetyltransferase [Fibrobacterota bacterium]|nr:GNAT family N-acetyltransferase [Fibrobacterota bacterium]